MREVEEGFKAGQKGSSAMPHKRNPITAERLSGLARILRGNLQAGLEDVALWHERDISHSSVERVILPDSSLLAYYVLRAVRARWSPACASTPSACWPTCGRATAWSSASRCCWRSSPPGCTATTPTASCRSNAMRAWDDGVPFRSLLEKDERVPLDGRRARRGVRPRPGAAPHRRRLRRAGRPSTTVTTSTCPHVHRGKVRDLYDAGDGRLLVVASDRISAFDVVMAEPVPDKGRVLTALSAFWFEHARRRGAATTSCRRELAPPPPRRRTPTWPGG